MAGLRPVHVIPIGVFGKIRAAIPGRVTGNQTSSIRNATGAVITTPVTSIACKA